MMKTMKVGSDLSEKKRSSGTRNSNLRKRKQQSRVDRAHAAVQNPSPIYSPTSFYVKLIDLIPQSPQTLVQSITLIHHNLHKSHPPFCSSLYNPSSACINHHKFVTTQICDRIQVNLCYQLFSYRFCVFL